MLAFLYKLCYHPVDIEKAMIGPSFTDQHRFSECGMVGAAWVQYEAFSRELPSERIRIATPVCALVRNDTK